MAASMALYYPDMSISDPDDLFDSLLYWNKVHCIVPFPVSDIRCDRLFLSQDMRKAVNEALQHAARPFVPSEQQKQAADALLKEALLQLKTPEQLANVPVSEAWGRDDVTVINLPKLGPLAVELLLISKWIDGIQNIRKVQDFLERAKAGKLTANERAPQIQIVVPKGQCFLLAVQALMSCGSQRD